MNWMFPSIVATLIGTVILALTYAYLYHIDRERFIFIWTISWWIYALRFLLMLPLISEGFETYKTFFLIGNQLASLASGLILLWGTHLFLRKKMPRAWLYAGVAFVPWIAFATGFHASLMIVSLPTYFFLGFVYVWTGVVLIQHMEAQSLGRKIVGVTFIVWGLHKADYPFVRPILWLAPWGYLLGASLEIVIAVGMLLIYFESTRQALRREKEFTDMVLNTQMDTFFVFEPATGKAVRWNRAFREISGYSDDEIRSMKAPDGYYGPADLQKARLALKTLAIKGVQTIEMSLRTKDNQLIPTEYSGSIIKDDGGAPRYVVSVGRDIRERKKAASSLQKSEERLRYLVDNMPIIVNAFNERGNIVFWNKECERITGYTAEEIVDNPDAMKMLYPDENYRRSMMKELLEKGFDFRDWEWELTCKDHSTKTISLTNISRQVPLPGWYTWSVGVDVTRRKQIETEKEALFSHVQQAQKMEAIGTLAGGIAHDFNNILAAIIGYTELAMDVDSQEDERWQGHLQQVLKAGNRAKELVQQILTFSRQTKIEKMPIQLKLIINEVLKLMRATLPATIEIRQKIHSNPLIFADASQVHQVLMNLCTNAWHAMGNGNGQLTVSLETVDLSAEDRPDHPEATSGPYAQLSVADTGHGIPPEIRDRIFDPFFTTKSLGEGTGMGLSQVHGIVESHGGKILVESTVGKGTIFRILFPVVNTRTDSREETKSDIPGGVERILLVDDEASLANMGKNMLESLGYDVTVRNNGREALELYQEKAGQFDLVITDMTMPAMTGEALAREILKISPHIPIILCTGFSAALDEEKARLMGVCEVVYKPLLRKDLALAIRRALDRNPEKGRRRLENRE